MMRILPVIVLYKCRLEDSKSFKSLLRKNHFESIFVYDNSPEAQIIDLDNLLYIHDSGNSGLGVAYNVAAKYAREKRFDWLLLLDQDTTFPELSYEYYVKAISENPNIKLFAPIHKISDGRYISPTRYICKGSHPVKTLKQGVLKFSKAAPINSGMLINVEAFWNVGGYDECVILDFSDIRFVEKFKKKYDVFFAIKEIVCLQDFSINVVDVRKLLTRFEIFLKCALMCKREHWWDNMGYFIVTVKRALRLSVQCRDVVFIKKYFSNYLFK